MNRTNQFHEHEEYRKILSSKEAKDSIKKYDKDCRNNFISMANNSKTDIFYRKFYNKTLNVFPKKDFYIHLQQFPENDSPSCLIFNDNDNTMSFIQFRLTSRSNEKYFDKLFNKYPVLIEIEALHSYEKGMGVVLVNQLKKLSDKMDMPIYLYDTNLKDEYYYQNLGFFDTNEKGVYGEPLLVYKPIKEDL